MAAAVASNLPRIIVALAGGAMDGEEWSIEPICSIGLPQQFRYISSDGTQAVWHVYEFPFHPGPGGGANWDLSPERMIFNYVGKEPVLK